MIRYFASHPTAANLLMLVFISVGLFSLPRILKETFPDYSPTEVEVRVVYPGATALEVEEAICQRIEDSVDGVLYIEEVLSEAREGVGIVTIEMQEDGNVQKFIDDIQTEVSAIDDFPEQAEIPLVRQLHTTDPVIAIAISGPMSVEDLKAYCEEIKDRLQIEEGISLVEIRGFSDHQIRIEVPAETLQQFGLSSADIAALISKQSLDLPSGILETSESNVLVRFSDERTTVPELENLVLLGGESGGEIRLGEIATITDLFELDEEKIEFNGSRAGVLQVSKNKNEDTLNISDAVKRFVEKERTVAPPGVRYTLTEDSSSIVRDRLQMLVKNGWQGLLLVVGVMWLFFPFRFSFWVAMGLPISFLGALFFFPQLGLSLNMITMVGLLVALGLLMDDAIVIAENIATHLAKGEGPLQAVVDGVSEVKMGVISSFVTTVCMFGPLSFLSGKIGKVLEVMPAALILVLSVSLIEAFFILPHHLGHAVSKKKRRSQGFANGLMRGWSGPQNLF